MWVGGGFWVGWLVFIRELVSTVKPTHKDPEPWACPANGTWPILLELYFDPIKLIGIQDTGGIHLGYRTFHLFQTTCPFCPENNITILSRKTWIGPHRSTGEVPNRKVNQFELWYHQCVKQETEELLMSHFVWRALQFSQQCFLWQVSNLLDLKGKKS